MSSFQLGRCHCQDPFKKRMIFSRFGSSSLTQTQTRALDPPAGAGGHFGPEKTSQSLFFSASHFLPPRGRGVSQAKNLASHPKMYVKFSSRRLRRRSLFSFWPTPPGGPPAQKPVSHFRKTSQSPPGGGGRTHLKKRYGLVPCRQPLGGPGGQGCGGLARSTVVISKLGPGGE